MIKFGASGNSDSFFTDGFSHSEDSAMWIKNKGLNAFEYSFGRGVNLGEAKAKSIGEAFKKAGVEISVHAPYFINFANTDDEMVEKSYNHVLSSAAAVKLMGGNRVVFHPATEGKATRADAIKLATERLKKLRDLIYINGFSDIYFCPETMGKMRQIGTIEEITELCKIDDIFVPTVDFGHINARENGSLKSCSDYISRLRYMVNELGQEKMSKFEVHFSKIQYTKMGEVRHLTFADEIYGPRYEPFIEAVKSLNLSPYIICESSGTQAEDALKMKEYYEKI